MTNALAHLAGFILLFFGVLAFAASAQAATPMLGCSAGMAFISDRSGEPQPAEHEFLLTLSDLPGVVPLVTTRGGYDFCVFYTRYPIDETLPPVNTGALSAIAYRLNKRDRWKKVARLSGVPVSDNVAFSCKNVKKKLNAGTTIRWVFRLEGMPALDLFDGYEIEAAILTGGAGELMQDLE